MRRLAALSAVVLVACNAGAPDGFTQAGWVEFQKAHPDQVEAVRFVQSSSKRREIRDLYILAMRGSSDLLDGHQRAQIIGKNKMTGADVFQDVEDAQLLYKITARNMKGAASRSFSEAVLEDLGIQQVRLDALVSVSDALLKDPALAPADREVATKRQGDAKRVLAGLPTAIAAIKSIGD